MGCLIASPSDHRYIPEPACPSDRWCVFGVELLLCCLRDSHTREAGTQRARLCKVLQDTLEHSYGVRGNGSGMAEDLSSYTCPQVTVRSAPEPRHAATHTHYSFFFKYNTAGGVTQPLYTAPCADLRAKRIVHDGTSVRWTLPALAGGIVRIPSTPLLDLHIAPNWTAWRMGGANDTYLSILP